MTAQTPVEAFNALLSTSSVLFVVCKLHFSSSQSTFSSFCPSAVLFFCLHAQTKTSQFIVAIGVHSAKPTFVLYRVSPLL